MKKLVVLSGAGMSAESGISTFRDAGGLWEEYPVEQVCTPEGLMRDTELVLEFYNRMRHQLLTKEPNQGHKLVAELENHFDVSVITQNVDDLHERAGSSHIVHLHGELMKVCSMRDVNNPNCIKTLTPDNLDIHVGDKAADGAQLRPFIVFFGEGVPEIETAIPIVESADIFVVIGTSLNVYPAAGLLNYVRPGTPIYLIDPKDVPTKGFGVTHIKKGASEGMKELISLLV